MESTSAFRERQEYAQDEYCTTASELGKGSGNIALGSRSMQVIMGFRGDNGKPTMPDVLIIAEVRRIREERAAPFNYDPRAIAEDARRRERESQAEVVELRPRPGGAD
jgi:hypothetical protein